MHCRGRMSTWSVCQPNVQHRDPDLFTKSNSINAVWPYPPSRYGYIPGDDQHKSCACLDKHTHNSFIWPWLVSKQLTCTRCRPYLHGPSIDPLTKILTRRDISSRRYKVAQYVAMAFLPVVRTRRTFARWVAIVDHSSSSQCSLRNTSDDLDGSRFGELEDIAELRSRKYHHLEVMQVPISSKDRHQISGGHYCLNNHGSYTIYPNEKTPLVVFCATL